MSIPRIGAFWAVLALLLSGPIPQASGIDLTICAIQSNTSDGDASFYDFGTFGELVDCTTGGLVVAKVHLSGATRLILYDPDCPDGWGGIQVKDRLGAGAFGNVKAGHWVSLTNMEVDEVAGTTCLQWYSFNNPGLTITSNGVPSSPPPIQVSVSDIPAPISTNGGWFVTNHDAEPWESMRLVVRDVTVGSNGLGLGKDEDNYVLEDSQGERCWAADYMNEARQPNPDYYDEEFHPFVAEGQHFCAVTGVLEQYTKLSADWDYYQLLTLNTIDLAICADGNHDGAVTLDDHPRFTECLTGPVCEQEPEGCYPPAWASTPTESTVQHCLMMDLDYDGDVDLFDFADLQERLGGP